MDNSLAKEVARLKRMLVVCLVLPSALALIAWKAQTPSVVKAQRIEIVDASGKVRGRIEAGKITLVNTAGEEKAVITADDQNGNMTLHGNGQKRISMFMSDSIPLIVLYNEKGEPVASLPAAIR